MGNKANSRIENDRINTEEMIDLEDRTIKSKKQKGSENKKYRVFEFWRQNQMALRLVIEFLKAKIKRMVQKKCLKRYWLRTYPQLLEINRKSKSKVRFWKWQKLINTYQD